MSRFTTFIESSAAIAADTGFAWLMSSANNGYKLRRITIGVRAGTGVPTSMQAVLGINRVTSAGTTPSAGMTPVRMQPWSAAAGAVWNSGYATPPTNAAADWFRVPINTMSGADLPWEFGEDAVVLNGTSNGLAFINRTNALPASHVWVLSCEWEE